MLRASGTRLAPTGAERRPLAGGYLTSQEETNGWMECESCHQLVKILDVPGVKTMDIPVYTPHQLMQRCHAAT